MSKFPFFSDSHTRDLFLLSLKEGFTLDPGDTLRHAAALKLGLYYDFEAVVKDAAELFRSEMIRYYAAKPTALEFLGDAAIHSSATFRAEIQTAIAPRIRQIDIALGQSKVALQPYEPASNMEPHYRQIMTECLLTARFNARADFDSEVARARAAEEAL